MPSKNTELAQEKEQRKDKEFLEEYKALVEPLNDKHGRRLIPMLSSDRHSIQAVFGIDRFKKEIINVESKTESKPDTDTQAS